MRGDSVYLSYHWIVWLNQVPLDQLPLHSLLFLDILYHPTCDQANVQASRLPAEHSYGSKARSLEQLQKADELKLHLLRSAHQKPIQLVSIHLASSESFAFLLISCFFPLLHDQLLTLLHDIL